MKIVRKNSTASSFLIMANIWFWFVLNSKQCKKYFITHWAETFMARKELNKYVLLNKHKKVYTFTHNINDQSLCRWKKSSQFVINFVCEFQQVCFVSGWKIWRCFTYVIQASRGLNAFVRSLVVLVPQQVA